jgi:hypothetical protein
MENNQATNILGNKQSTTYHHITQTPYIKTHLTAFRILFDHMKTLQSLTASNAPNKENNTPLTSILPC